MVFHQDEEHRVDGAGAGAGPRQRGRGGRTRRRCRGCSRGRGGAGGGRGGDIAGGCRGALICYTHAASADLAWTAADAAVTLLASGNVQYAVSAYRKAGGEVPPKFQLAGNQGAPHDRARVVNRCPQAYFALKAGTAFPPGSDLRPRLRQPNFDGNGSAGSAYRNRRPTDYDRFVG